MSALEFNMVPNRWPESSKFEIEHGLPWIESPPSPYMALDSENHVLRDELTNAGPLAWGRFAKIIPMSNP